MDRSRLAGPGFSEIRVSAGLGVMFAAPLLIWYYVTAHTCRPPDSFVEAVQNYDPDWVTGGWIPADAERDDF